MPVSYAEFLMQKKRMHLPSGFDVKDGDITAAAHPFQRYAIRTALRAGKYCLFEDCGLGKTLQQLEWARLIHEHTKRDILIVAPLAVSKQTQREGEKFGERVNICRKQADVKPGINITNYEMIQHFDFKHFVGLVLDESSILKSHTGAMRAALIEAAQVVPYRLACTATPSPNDWMELGNHSEFIGYQTRIAMLATYFNHDGGETSKWKLKGHAAKAFWRSCASWSLMIEKPSDIGFDDSGYALTPIMRHFHEVQTNAQDGVLFPVEASDLSERRESRKISVKDRVQRLAGMIDYDRSNQWLVWGDLNAETNAAEEAISGAVQVEGADSQEWKESALLGFANGEHRVLVTKPKIGGWGMNWQNCHKMAFLGLSDSYESTYQAERRCWRYGQKHPVEVHTFVTDRDGAVIRNIERKRKQAEDMRHAMVQAMRESMEVAA